MKDKLFDKIKASHKDSPGYQLPDDALADFRNYSKKRDRLSTSMVNKYLLGSLILLLLGSNIFWILKNLDTIASPNTTANQSAVVTDTKTDTVYITKYLNTTQGTKLLNNSQDLTTEKELLTTKYEAQLADLSASIRALENRLTYSESLNNRTAFSTNESDLRTAIRTPILDDAISKKASPAISVRKKNRYQLGQELAVLPQLPWNLLKYRNNKINVGLYNRITLEHKKKQSFIELLTPKTLSLFGQLGFYNEKGTELPNISGSKYSIGLTSLFSKHIRVRLSLSTARAKGELENDMLIPSDFPQVVAPEGAVFDELYFSSRLNSLSLGLEYLLRPMRFVRPYLGLNYSQGHQRYFDIEYNYYHQNSKLELVAANTTKTSNTHLGFLIGSDINLTSNLDGLINLGYYYNLKGNLTSYFLINTGIQYHF